MLICKIPGVVNSIIKAVGIVKISYVSPFSKGGLRFTVNEVMK